MFSHWVNDRISIEEHPYEVIRLLMNADPTIDSMRKHNLKFDALDVPGIPSIVC
jgi:hypothetical protein